jgi:hypothetical protein
VELGIHSVVIAAISSGVSTGVGVGPGIGLGVSGCFVSEKSLAISFTPRICQTYSGWRDLFGQLLEKQNVNIDKGLV